MIRLFQEPAEAIDYANSIVSGSASGLVAFVSRAEPLWIAGEQILIFPVIEIDRIPTIDLFDAFCSDFSLDAEVSKSARGFILKLDREEIKYDILRISEWIVDIRISGANKSLFDDVITRAQEFNKKIVLLLREKYGRMRPVVPQPFQYHKDLGLIRIGAR